MNTTIEGQAARIADELIAAAADDDPTYIHGLVQATSEVPPYFGGWDEVAIILARRLTGPDHRHNV